jgi:hypothetical protein
MKKATILIKQSSKIIFDYLLHLNDAQWRSGVLDMKLTSATYEGLGATHIEIRKVPGKILETKAKVVAYEPNQIWSVQRIDGPIRPEARYILREVGEGTELTFEFTIHVMGKALFFLTPLARLAEIGIMRAFRVDLIKLKQILEK